MKGRGLFFILFITFTSNTLAQGYGDAEEVTVTTAPVLIDCGTPPAPKAIQWPTLPPFKPIQWPTLPPPRQIPLFPDLFSTSGYATGPPTTTQAYHQSPPKIPTFNELFPPVAPVTTESYAQPPKIDYVPAPVAPSTYQTAPQPFTMFPPIPKMPTFSDLFPPAPVAPVTPKQQPIATSYEVGPPSVQPEEPYSSNEKEDMEGDEMLLQPVENENLPVISSDQPLQINAMPIKTAKFESTKIVVKKPSPPSFQKLKKMIERKHKVNGVKTFREIQLGTSHHVDAHNHHQNPHRKI